MEPEVGGASLVPQRLIALEGQNWLLGDGGACVMAAGGNRCYQTPGHRIVRVRGVAGHWWLLTDTGPAFRIDGGVATRIPDEKAEVVDVHQFAGATWLVTRRGGKAGPLLRVDF